VGDLTAGDLVLSWDAFLDQACQVLHDAYEKAAPRHGWDTQTGSRKPWSDVPEENKATMREAVAEFLTWYEGQFN